MALIKLVQQGGVFMIPLLFMSVVALGIGLERLTYFVQLDWGGVLFEARLREFMKRGRLNDAVLWLTGLRGPLSSVAVAGLRKWERGREAVEEAMSNKSHQESVNLNRHLAILETIVTASPLIGLLGTITGMMGVFRAVSEKMALSPQADTSGILAGIGEALVATATGICVAVVCLFFHNVFAYLAEVQSNMVQAAANEIIEILEEQGG
jgi:biopolymer transport protein ExbB